MDAHGPVQGVQDITGLVRGKAHVPSEGWSSRQTARRYNVGDQVRFYHASVCQAGARRPDNWKCGAVTAYNRGQDMADPVEMLERITRNLPIRGRIAFRRFQSSR